MPIDVRCSCGKLLRVRDESAGRKVRCSACGAINAIPLAPEPEPELQPAEPTVPCPYCTSPIAASETVCPHCREDVTAPRQPRLAPRGRPPAGRRPSAGLRGSLPARHGHRAGALRQGGGLPGEAIVIAIFTVIIILLSLVGMVTKQGQVGRAAEYEGCGTVVSVLMMAGFGLGLAGLLLRQAWGWWILTLLYGLCCLMVAGLGAIVVLGMGALGSQLGPEAGTACGCIAAVFVVLAVVYGVPLALLIRIRSRF